MKFSLQIFPLALLLCFLTLTNSCKKDEEEKITVTDIDGNLYHAVKIGSQVWMVENLKVTHYRNGDPIPNVIEDTAWHNLTTGAYCNYNHDTNYSKTYGRLYNWYTVMDVRNIAPAGWHIATDKEWFTLTDYLGGVIAAGSKLQESGSTHWKGTFTSATNASGFTALPAGYRHPAGTFLAVTFNCSFWSTTEFDKDAAYGRYLGNADGSVGKYNQNKKNGISVRCLRD